MSQGCMTCRGDSKLNGLWIWFYGDHFCSRECYEVDQAARLLRCHGEPEPDDGLTPGGRAAAAKIRAMFRVSQDRSTFALSFVEVDDREMPLDPEKP